MNIMQKQNQPYMYAWKEQKDNDRCCNCKCCTCKKRYPPTVTTGNAAGINQNFASIINNTFSGFFETINFVAIQYSTNPTMAFAAITYSPIAGSPFSVNLTDLRPGTTYYYRTVVSTVYGVYLGAVKAFVTRQRAPIPTGNAMSALKNSVAMINNATGVAVNRQKTRSTGNPVAATRQLFDASPVNIIDSIVITQETDPSNVLIQWSAFDPSITVYSDLKSTQAVDLFINWSDQNGAVDLQQGDYFTFVVPDIFIYDFITNATDVPIKNPSGEIVATYSIYDNISNMKEVRITFTDYVENHTNISGNFWMLLFVARVDSTERETIEFIINDNVVAEGEVTINPNTGTYTPRNVKIGYSSPNDSAGGYYIFEWDVYINMDESANNGFNTLADFSFEDIIPADSPHVFLTDEIRQELGILPIDYQAAIGEYTGADFVSLESRYQMFFNHYNSTGANIWYNFINWNTLANGLTTTGIDGNGGLNVSDVEITDKLFSANLGTLTRPTAIRFFTIATIKMTESALGDSEVVKLFKNTFSGSYGEDLSSSLTIYRFEAGGSAQGITGDYSFSFNKVNENDVVLSGAMFSLFTNENLAAGADRFTFSGDDGVVTFNHLPVGTYYLQETVAPIGYIPNSTVYRVVISSGGVEIYYGPNFENRLSDINNTIVNRSEYQSQPVSVAFTGTKNLTGRTLESGMFSFIVKNEGGNVAATGTNNADGSIVFSNIEFDAPGVYNFTVEEVMGSSSGIIYDGSIFAVTVTVSDDGSGNLTAEVAYPLGSIVFNNSYEEIVIQPVSVTFTGTKNLTGRTLESGMFSFIVKNEGSNVAATGTNNADGSIVFSNIEFDAPGVYNFTVEEVMGSSSGIIYDGSIFAVTVTVTDDGSGNLTAEVAYPLGSIVFNNSYEEIVIQPVSVTFTGTKNLTGRTLESGMFSFIVKNEDDNIAATGANNADGSIVFGSIEFDAPGVYNFTVEEVMGSSSGIIYDGSVFLVTVTVTDDGSGNLTAEVAYPLGSIVFNNSYEEIVIQPVSVTFTGTKNLTGRTLESGMFSFIVKNEDDNIVATGANNADGSIVFGRIEFDAPGVYNFTVEEVMGSSSGIIYDGSVFPVTVTVTDDGSGNLTAEVAYPLGSIVFNNSYEEIVIQPVSVTFTGTKNLICKALTGGMFSFAVKDIAGNIVAIGINDANGSIHFSSIEFSLPGIYSFTVEEVRGNNSGIIYDGSIFYVTVTVADDGSGNLTAEVAYLYGDIVFNNRYVTTPVKPCLCCMPCCQPRCIHAHATNNTISCVVCRASTPVRPFQCYI